MMEKISKILGISFGAVGLFLLLYAGYFTFFFSNENNIVHVLPSENFEFIAFGSENSKNIPADILEAVPFYVPENNAVVSYFNPLENRSEFIIISQKPYLLHDTSDLLCSMHKKYQLCTNKKNIDTFKNVQKFIERENSSKNNKSIKNIAYLLSSYGNSVENIFDKNANISFFGTTEFLLKNVQNSELESQMKMAVEVLSFSKGSLLYFSGKGYENEFSLKLYKKDKNEENIFVSSRPSFLLSEIITLAKTGKDNNFLYISRPQNIFDYSIKSKISVDFVENISAYFQFRQLFTDMFHGNISYFNDVEPLLSGNVLVADEFIGVELASNEVAQMFYETYYTLLKDYTSRVQPEKKCFTLSDKSEACEVFPSQSTVDIEEKKNENGELALFLSQKNPNTNTQEHAYVFRKNNMIFLANRETDMLEKIFENTEKYLVNNSEIFLHYTHEEAQEEKQKSITLIGKETKESIEFIKTFK